MQGNNGKRIALRVVSVLMVFGGVVRLFATKGTFQSFLIGDLWISHPYFTYIYRVLGAFVIFAGMTIFTMAQEPTRYARLLKICGLCFSIIALVMFIAGFLLRMFFTHYAFDVVFCIIAALVCFSFGDDKSLLRQKVE